MRSIPGRCTFTTSAVPSWALARCDCAIDAVPSGRSPASAPPTSPRPRSATSNLLYLVARALETAIDEAQLVAVSEVIAEFEPPLARALRGVALALRLAPLLKLLRRR